MLAVKCPMSPSLEVGDMPGSLRKSGGTFTHHGLTFLPRTLAGDDFEIATALLLSLRCVHHTICCLVTLLPCHDFPERARLRYKFVNLSRGLPHERTATGD